MWWRGNPGVLPGVHCQSHGLALNITIQSYNGSLDYGFIACKKAIPKVEQFAKFLQAEHAGMMKAMEKGPESFEQEEHYKEQTNLTGAFPLVRKEPRQRK